MLCLLPLLSVVTLSLRREDDNSYHGSCKAVAIVYARNDMLTFRLLQNDVLFSEVPMGEYVACKVDFFGSDSVEFPIDLTVDFDEEILLTFR